MTSEPLLPDVVDVNSAGQQKHKPEFIMAATNRLSSGSGRSPDDSHLTSALAMLTALLPAGQPSLPAESSAGEWHKKLGELVALHGAGTLRQEELVTAYTALRQEGDASYLGERPDQVMRNLLQWSGQGLAIEATDSAFNQINELTLDNSLGVGGTSGAFDRAMINRQQKVVGAGEVVLNVDRNSFLGMVIRVVADSSLNSEILAGIIRSVPKYLLRSYPGDQGGIRFSVLGMVLQGIDGTFVPVLARGGQWLMLNQMSAQGFDAFSTVENLFSTGATLHTLVLVPQIE